MNHPTTLYSDEQLLPFLYGFLLDAEARGASDRRVSVAASGRHTARLTLTHDGNPRAAVSPAVLGSPLYQAFLTYAPRFESTPTPAATPEDGLHVAFHVRRPAASLHAAFEQALRHYPKGVNLESPVPHAAAAPPQAVPFLGGALTTSRFETVYGPITAGVFMAHLDPFDFCAGGILRQVGLPLLTPPRGHAKAGHVAHVRVDATGAPGFMAACWHRTFDRPHRQALTDIVPSLRTFLYRHVVDTRLFTLRSADAAHARDLGIDLTGQARRVRLWQPGGDSGPAPLIDLPETPVAVVACDPAAATALRHATRHSGADLVLIEADPTLNDHDWFRRLPRLTACAPFVRNGTHVEHLDPTALDGPGLTSTHVPVDDAWIKATFTEADGLVHTQRHATNLLSSGEVNNYLLATVYTTPDHALTPEAIARYLEDVYFTAYAEEDLDHEATQRQFFREEAIDFAVRVVDTPEAALARHLELALQVRVVPGVALRGRRATVTITDDGVSATVSPPLPPTDQGGRRS